jgi:hypothetical protein
MIRRLALLVLLSWPSLSFAQSIEQNPEFIFTYDEVVSLKWPFTSRISINSRFNDLDVIRSFPEYDVNYHTVEDSDGYIISKENDEFITILGNTVTGEISHIWDIDRAIDGLTGTYVGMSLINTDTDGFTVCTTGIATYCDSEHSPFFSYMVGWDETCPVDFREGEEIRILTCMKVEGFELSPVSIK